MASHRWTAVIAMCWAWLVCVLPLRSNGGEISIDGRSGEFLAAAKTALAEILQVTARPSCSVILVTDGSSSPKAVQEVVERIQPLFGIQVFEILANSQTINKTDGQLAYVIGEATRIRKTYTCVLVIAATNNHGFMDALLSLYSYDLPLVWKQRPIVVTSLPLSIVKEVVSKYWPLFGTSAMVVHVQRGRNMRRWIGVYTHLPFSPEEGGQVVKMASWSTLRGLVTAPKDKLYPTKDDKFCCGRTISVKEALKDPVTLYSISTNPGTFKFEKPVTVVLAGEHWPTHIVLQESQNKNQMYDVGGSMGSLLDAIAQSVNFSYKLVRPEDGQWGSRNEDGSWTGMVGLVHTQVADMALGPHDITLIRMSAIDYTAPIFTDARQFVLAQNRAEVDPWGFLLPLSPTVWVGVVMAFTVIAMVTIPIGSNYRKDPPPIYASSVFFHTFRLLLQQGLTMKLKKTSERIVVLSWLIAAMIICWSYSMNLMSLLAVRYAPKPVQSIQDLLDDNGLVAIFPRRTALSDYVLSQESGILKEVADLRQIGRYKDLHYNDFPKALETLVLRGDHAIATCTTDAVNIIAKYFSNKGSCNFYIARETFVPFMLAMIGQKGSPLVEAVSQRIQGIVAGGLYQHWLDSNLPNSTSCKNMPSSYTVKEPLAMSNIWGMFVLLGFGIGMAVVVFWVEIFVGKCFDMEATEPDSNPPPTSRGW